MSRLLGSLFAFHGRTTRRGYLLANVVIYAMLYGGGLILLVSLTGMHADLPERDRLSMLPPSFRLSDAVAWPLLVVGSIGILAGLVVDLATAVRRFHDLGLTGFFIIGTIVVVPMVPDPSSWPNALPGLGSLLVDAILLVVPGRRGANRYGADPRDAGSDAIATVFDTPQAVPEGETRQR